MSAMTRFNKADSGYNLSLSVLSTTNSANIPIKAYYTRDLVFSRETLDAPVGAAQGPRTSLRDETSPMAALEDVSAPLLGHAALCEAQTNI